MIGRLCISPMKSYDGCISQLHMMLVIPCTSIALIRGVKALLEYFDISNHHAMKTLRLIFRVEGKKDEESCPSFPP